MNMHNLTREEKTAAAIGQMNAPVTSEFHYMIFAEYENGLFMSVGAVCGIHNAYLIAENIAERENTKAYVFDTHTKTLQSLREFQEENERR